MNDRRRFLKRIGAGSALLTLPPFLAGCGVLPATDVSEPPAADPFVDWFALDEPRLAKLLAALGARGGDFGEIFAEHARSTSLLLDDGDAQAPQVDIRQGAGLRVVNGDTAGFAHTEDLTLAGLLAAARSAANAPESAGAAPPAIRERNVDDRYAIAVPWSAVGSVQKWSILERADAAARAAGDGVAAVSVDWRDEDRRVLIATLDGQVVVDRRPLTRLALTVSVIRRGVTHAGFASVSARRGIDWYDDELIREVAGRAVRRAELRFAARSAPQGEMPVVLAAGNAGILLHEVVGHALEGDFNASGASRFAGALGSAVAADNVTLIDDATLGHARGALNVDDEGRDTARNVLVENGILRSYLHDSRSALRLAAVPTGSGRRSDFRSMPLPRMSCTYLDSGDAEPAALLEGVRLGIVVDTLAGGRADPATGDFRFVVRTGWLVENGRRTMPVRDAVLAGNGAALLGSIEQVANDLAFTPGGWTCGKQGQRLPVSVGAPSLRLAGLAIGNAGDA